MIGDDLCGASRKLKMVAAPDDGAVLESLRDAARRCALELALATDPPGRGQVAVAATGTAWLPWWCAATPWPFAVPACLDTAALAAALDEWRGAVAEPRDGRVAAALMILFESLHRESPPGWAVASAQDAGLELVRSDQMLRGWPTRVRLAPAPGVLALIAWAGLPAPAEAPAGPAVDRLAAGLAPSPVTMERTAERLVIDLRVLAAGLTLRHVAAGLAMLAERYRRLLPVALAFLSDPSLARAYLLCRRPPEHA